MLYQLLSYPLDANGPREQEAANDSLYSNNGNLFDIVDNCE